MANLTLSWLEESPKKVVVGGGDPGVSIFLYFYLLFLPLDLRDCVCVCVWSVWQQADYGKRMKSHDGRIEKLTVEK